MKKLFLLFVLLFLSAPNLWAASTIYYKHLEPETVAYYTTAAGTSTLDQFTANENIKKVKYGTGIIVVGFTCNLSIVNGGATASGGAFITNPPIDLRQYVGCKITLNDGTQNLVGWIKAAGTGETLGDELITGWTNITDHLYETFTSSGTDITSAIETGTDGRAKTSPSYTSTILLACYKMTTSLTILSGSLSHLKFTGEPSLTGASYELKSITPVTGSYIFYGTPNHVNYNTYGLIFGYRTTGVVSFTSTGNSIKQVLTPSATGVTIVSTQGGATYNWASNGEILPNATSFVAIITAQ